MTVVVLLLGYQFWLILGTRSSIVYKMLPGTHLLRLRMKKYSLHCRGGQPISLHDLSYRIHNQRLLSCGVTTNQTIRKRQADLSFLQRSTEVCALACPLYRCRVEVGDSWSIWVLSPTLVMYLQSRAQSQLIFACT